MNDKATKKIAYCWLSIVTRKKRLQGNFEDAGGRKAG